MTDVIRFASDPNLEPSKVQPRSSFTTADTTDRGHVFFRADNGSVMTGVWEGAPARFEVESYPQHEFMSVLSGSVTVTDVEAGRSETFNVGDTFFVSKGSHIIWEITETMRKHYVIVPDTPSSV